MAEDGDGDEVRIEYHFLVYQSLFALTSSKYESSDRRSYNINSH